MKPKLTSKKKLRSFEEKRMHDFKEGEMHATKKNGPVVTSKPQAVAIMLSEARKKGAKLSKKSK